MKRAFRKLCVHSSLAFVAFVPMLAHAAAAVIKNPINSPTLALFLLDLVKIIRDIGFIALVFFIVFTGFKYIMAAKKGGGDSLKEAHRAAVGVAIGGPVLLGAWIFARALDASIRAIH